MCIRVDTSEDMPKYLIDKVERIRPDLTANDYIDEIARRDDVVQLLGELNQYCISQGVVGTHYTRSFRDSIQRNGLQAKSGQERREQFLREYGNLFTANELEQIRSAYSEYFTHSMNSVRDNRIWFNLSRVALRGGGAGRLLDHFGGEVVYFPLTHLPSICAKIRNLGEPLIVECRLHPEKIHGFWPYPVALVWLSSYQTRINPNARLYDQDVYSLAPISPEDVLSVESPAGWQ